MTDQQPTTATAATAAPAPAPAATASGGDAKDSKAGSGGSGGVAKSGDPTITHYKLEKRDPSKFVPKVIPKPPVSPVKGPSVSSYLTLLNQEREMKIWNHKICTLNENVYKLIRDSLQAGEAGVSGYQLITNHLRNALKAVVGGSITVGVIYGSAIRDFHSSDASAPPFSEDVLVYLLTDANPFDSKQLTFIRKQMKAGGVKPRPPLPMDMIFEALYKKDFTKPVVAGSGSTAGSASAAAPPTGGGGIASKQSKTALPPMHH